MCVCDVCLYVSVGVGMHRCIHVFISIYLSIYLCVCECMYLRIFTYMYECTCVYYTYVYTYEFICVYLYSCNIHKYTGAGETKRERRGAADEQVGGMSCTHVEILKKHLEFCRNMCEYIHVYTICVFVCLCESVYVCIYKYICVDAYT